MSVDETDSMIYEPSPFSPKWYIHTFNGPGLRYEIAVSQICNNICWVKGKFLCGSYKDKTIFYNSLAMEM